MVGTA
jgi:hypothetical protein